MTALGAPAGEAGPPAQAGPAGEPGVGGKNLVYVHWRGKHSGYAGESKNRHVVEMVKKYAIATRAAGGKKTAGPGTVPPQPVGSPGRGRAPQASKLGPFGAAR